tara:strand:+ start:57064 stop:57561 length:498 start_codon:yes stop_codon:yes gene_type:complete
MKKLNYLLLIFLALVAFYACEKDDICVDGNTPLLVIRFYDIDNPETLKTPSNLVVKGQLTDGTYGATIANTSVDSIQIPLRNEALSTVYSLATNTTTDVTNANEDIITFNYTTKEVFISRACGFINNYENLATELTTDTDNWIKEIKIDTTVIANQNAAHVKIYH